MSNKAGSTPLGMVVNLKQIFMRLHLFDDCDDVPDLESQLVLVLRAVAERHLHPRLLPALRRVCENTRHNHASGKTICDSALM